MKKWVLGFLVLNLISPLAWASEKKETKTEIATEEAEEAEYNKWRESVFSTDAEIDNGLVQERKHECEPICDTPLKIKIGGLPLSVPRAGYTFYTADGKVYMSTNRRCDIRSLDNVKTFENDLFFITSSQVGSKEKFEKSQKKIDEMKSKRQGTILPNGVEKFAGEHFDYYVFPQDIITTYNGHPAVFNCMTYKLDSPKPPKGQKRRPPREYEMCFTSYYIQPNLLIDYRIDSITPEYSDEIFLPKHNGQTDAWIKQYVDVINETFKSFKVKEVKKEKSKWEKLKSTFYR